VRRMAITWLLAASLLFMSSPTWAFFDAIVDAARTAREAVYEKFMMIKAIEQLKALRDNYEASIRYYALFKSMNEGKGFLPNVAHRLADIGQEQIQEAEQQFEDDWVRDEGYGSSLDAAINKMDAYTSSKIRYAGRVFKKSLEAEDQGEKIFLDADLLDPKSTERMILKTEALQLELAAETNANVAELLDVEARACRLGLEEKEDRLRGWNRFDKSLEEAGLSSSSPQ